MRIAAQRPPQQRPAEGQGYRRAEQEPGKPVLKVTPTTEETK